MDTHTSPKPTLHFIDVSSRTRAELARTGFALGHHCEVYGDITELAAHPPREGIVFARDPDLGGIAQVLERLAVLGIWLPLIAFSDRPQPPRIVAAMKAGALDYLPFPLDSDRLSLCLVRNSNDALIWQEARQRMLDARNRIANLSARERQVLDWLTEGSSNKAIARELEISPRTVEIHRANMMNKLGATHPADAVRLRLDARLENAVISAGGIAA